MNKKQKMITIICIVVGVVIIAAGLLYFFVFRNHDSSSPDEVAYVDSVAAVTGVGGATGVQNRFTGVVESQETKDYKKNSDKKIKEIYVEVGQDVSVGTPLFEYDTEETALELAQAKIDLESLSNEITGLYNQISELQKEKAKAPASEQLSYTTQIQSAQINAKRAEYNKQSKEAEIEKKQKEIDSAIVTSDISGLVKAINENGGYDYNSGNELPFMTIMALGDYRIKGKVNEQNVWTLSEGQPVIVRSRIDETTWKGTISLIDTKNTYSDNNSNGGGVIVSGGGSNAGESGQTSSNYAFYVALDNADGLMMGQHVFIELDHGQDTPKDGLWLSSMYLILEENDAYVWVANDKNKLEKRKIELGNYDASLDAYEILSGLTPEEYIAFPGNLLHEGMSCVLNDGTHTNSSDGMNGEDGGMDSGMDGMDGAEGSTDMIDGAEDGVEGGMDLTGGAEGSVDLTGDAEGSVDLTGGAEGSVDGTDGAVDDAKGNAVSETGA